MMMKKPSDIRIVTTGVAYQITPEQYHGDAGYDNPDTHLIDGSFVELFPCVYRQDVSRTMADADDSVFFQAEPSETWDVYDRAWYGFLEALSEHFLGEPSVTTVRNDPGSHRNHPFFSLIATGHFGGGLSPAAVKDLERDFVEAENSGEARRFLEKAHDPHPEFVVLYELLRRKVAEAAQRNGMLTFR